MNGRDFEGELNVCLERGEGLGDMPVKETKNIFFGNSGDVDKCVIVFTISNGALPQTPITFLLMKVCFFKVFASSLRSVALIKKVTKNIKKFPRQSAALTRRQRLKSVQGFHFSLRLCRPLLAGISAEF
ncbi:MAG: hypothetical protein ACK5CO_02360 [Bacteroidota bacterium]